MNSKYIRIIGNKYGFSGDCLKRNVIKLGASYTVSLPKGWAERFGITGKKEIEMAENETGDIVISAREKAADEKETSVHVNANDSSQMIYAKTYRAYVQGYRKISIIGNIGPKQYEFINDVQRKFIGLEVVEQSEKKIVLKDFMHLEDVDIDKFTSRMFNYVIGMAQELSADIKSGIEIGDKYHTMDMNVDRTANLLFRCLNMALEDSAYMRASKKNAREIMIFSRIIKNIEKMGNMIVGISYYMNEKPTQRMKDYNYLLFRRDAVTDEYTARFLLEWVEYIRPLRDALFNKKTDVAMEIYVNRRSKKTRDIMFRLENEHYKVSGPERREYISKLESHFEPIVALSYEIAKDVIAI